ncbi:hypothetical protein D3C72_1856990 [compost metagenome]
MVFFIVTLGVIRHFFGRHLNISVIHPQSRQQLFFHRLGKGLVQALGGNHPQHTDAQVGINAVAAHCMRRLPLSVIGHQLRIVGHVIRDKQRQTGGVGRQIQQGDMVKGTAAQRRQISTGRIGKRHFAFTDRVGRQGRSEGFAQ